MKSCPFLATSRTTQWTGGLVSDFRCVADVRVCSLDTIECLSFSLSVPCLCQVAPILAVTDIPCKVAPFSGRLLHLPDEDRALPTVQSTFGAYQGLLPPGRVPIPGFGFSGEDAHYFTVRTTSGVGARRARRNWRRIQGHAMRIDVTTPEWFVDFNELWSRSMKADLATSGAGRAEED